MSNLRQQSNATYPLIFMMVDSTDHVSAKTGLTPTVTLSKNGGAFASPSGAVSEIASGWYKVAGNTTDSNTLGPLILHATGTGADPTDVVFDIVSHDPFARGTAQTGDSYARLGAPAGASVSADVAAVKSDTAAVKTKTDFLPSATAGAAGGVFIAGSNAATSITTALTANITGNLSGSVGSVTGAVGSVTGAVGSVTGAVGSVTGAVGSVTGNVGGNVTGSVGSVATNGITATSLATDAINAASVKADAVTKIQNGLATPTNITAGTITTVTNLTNLPAAAALEATLTAMKGATFSGATDSLEAIRDRGDAAWATATGFATPTNITAASGITLAPTTGLGNQTANITGNLSGSVGSVTGAVGSVTGAVGSVTGLTAANLDATVSSRLATAGYTAPPSAASNATELLDQAAGVETGLTVRQALRLALAALAGKLSGAATTSVVIRNAVADSKDRITATVDADGNRSAITTDLT